MPLAAPALCFALGTLAPDKACGEGWRWLIAAALTAALALYVRGTRGTVLVWIAALLAGAGWRAACDPWCDDIAWLARSRPGPVRVSGRLRADALVWPGRARLELDGVRIGDESGTLSGTLRVIVQGLPDAGVPILDWRAGDEVQAMGSLRAPRNAGNPGARDFIADLNRQGVAAMLVVRSPRLMTVRAGSASGWLRHPLAHLRRALGAALDARLAGQPFHAEGDREAVREAPRGPVFLVRRDAREAAIARALLLGDESRLEPQALARMAEAGIIHILAVSGMNVAFVAWLVYAAAGAVRLGERSTVLAAVIATWAYAGLAGFAAPVVRAAVMATVVLLGRALYREAPALNILSLALVVGLALEPAGLGGAGFQLTYAATASLLLLGPLLRSLLPARPAALWSLLAMSLAAQAGVLPLVAWHFHRVSPWAPLASLPAVPASAAVMGLGFATALASPLSDTLADGLAGLTRLAVDVIFRVADSDVLAWSWRVPSPPWWVMLAYGLSLAAVATAIGSSSRRIVPVALAGFALALALVVVCPFPGVVEPGGGLALHVVDVGQGDALLVESPHGRRLLVDGGGTPHSDFDEGEMVLLPALLARRVRTLDYVVLSHAHPDHAEGLLSVLEALRVGELWLGDDPAGDPIVARLEEVARRRGVRVRRVRRVERSDWDGVAITVLNPPAGLPPAPEVDNDRSVVLSLAYGDRRMLLTGDVAGKAEAAMMNSSSDLAAGVLKIAHHGSAGSSSEAFLDASRPHVAVISCGVDNRYGHPAPELLARLARRHVLAYRTDRDGMVTLWTDGRRLIPRAFRP